MSTDSGRATRRLNEEHLACLRSAVAQLSELGVATDSYAFASPHPQRQVKGWVIFEWSYTYVSDQGNCPVGTSTTEHRHGVLLSDATTWLLQNTPVTVGTKRFRQGLLIRKCADTRYLPRLTRPLDPGNHGHISPAEIRRQVDAFLDLHT